MSYTVKLVNLECFAAEEIDGDEVYIKLNGAKVWAAHPDKMTHVPKDDHTVNQYDFAGGYKHTHAGWLPLTPDDPKQFVFSGQSGAAVLQLWDTDAITSHDLLGETPIDPSQASGGNISVVFKRLGAHYRLT